MSSRAFKVVLSEAEEDMSEHASDSDDPVVSEKENITVFDQDGSDDDEDMPNVSQIPSTPSSRYVTIISRVLSAILITAGFRRHEKKR